MKAASPFQLLQRVVGALGALESFNERARLGNNLFAESWLKLNPLIDAGAEGFADANTIFGRLGLGIGKNADAVQLFNDKLDSLRQLGIAIRDKVFATLAPRLATFASGLFDAAAAFVEAQGGGEAFAETLTNGNNGAQLDITNLNIVASDWFESAGNTNYATSTNWVFDINGNTFYINPR